MTYILILVVALLVFQTAMRWTTQQGTTVSYNELIDLVEGDAIASIAIMNNQLVGMLKVSKIQASDFPRQYDFDCNVDRTNFFNSVRIIRAEKLGKLPDEISDSDLGFTIEYLPPVTTPWYIEFLPYLIVTLLMCGFILFVMRQQAGGGGKVMTFGRSRARVYDPSKNKITFADVAGADEEKEELAEIVEFLKNPKRFTAIGARIPKGVLLVGPPGTGKTLLAKAVAGEANAPFLSISGSDFVEMFVGVGASRVRDLFDQAKKHTPSIVFIDEIDAVGRHRGAGLGGGHDEREQTLNQLLVEMDGFSNNEGVIVLAATNRRDILDPALLRPGRFDRQITVNYPDIAGREAILKIHSRGKPLDNDVNLYTVARRTPFFTGADLENVMNEAAILAARANATRITERHIEEAITRVEMGPEKKSRKVTEHDRKVTAYHEAGHAIVGMALPKSGDVHMVTIVPRGESGGHTQYLKAEESQYLSRGELLDRVAMALGGRAAESLIFDDVTSGAISDLQSATNIVRNMITKLGMSAELGPVFYGGDQEVFVGRDFGHTRDYSDKVAAAIDDEIRRTMEESLKRSVSILEEMKPRFVRLAELLLEKETVVREELEAIMKDKRLPRNPEKTPPDADDIIIAPEAPDA
ncbi:MAG: ATP-dependent zinc metalloprotease FtsH [Oscillospiraceae bacterium]|jgi:cell division protease FtsH|nr:ATP-dependent zinc metalloprotease FtsH [Oscillospiraceae bacterium]